MRNIVRSAMMALLMVGQILTIQAVSAAPLSMMVQSSSTDSLDEEIKGFFPDFDSLDDMAGKIWESSKENIVAGAVVGVVAGVLAVAMFTPVAVTIVGATVAALTSEATLAVATGLYVGGLAIYEDAKERAAEKKAQIAQNKQAQQVQEEQYAYSQASRDRDKGRQVALDLDHASLMRAAMEAEFAGLRVESGNGFATSFGGKNADGSLTYFGTRVNGRIQGQYMSREDEQSYTGIFSGNIQRNGSVSGNYVEGSEVGVFSGQASPNLDKIFSGGAACTSGCD